jgi:hypothetical protein
MATPVYRKRTFLNGDRLTINGEHYTTQNLDQLPDDLDPRLIATKTDGPTTIFFGQNSPLSNHHPSPMVVDSKEYSCNEQYYFGKRAEVLGDDSIHCKVMGATDPKAMLRHGRKAQNKNGLTEAKIEEAEIQIMKRGAREKFGQNPALKEFLISTGQTRIGESSPSNKRWGTGYYLGHKDSFNTNLWHTNLLGDILQELRNSYAQ